MEICFVMCTKEVGKVVVSNGYIKTCVVIADAVLVKWMCVWLDAIVVCLNQNLVKYSKYT